MHGMRPSGFFSREEKMKIREAIAQAEKRTSGEIRVHLLRRFSKDSDPLEEGKKIFEKLGMTRTELRNGILFILAVGDRRFVVLGDKGIDTRVPDDFWGAIRDTVLAGFRQGDYAGGLVNGILKCGEKLKAHFPRETGDINELPDEISHGSSEDVP